MNAIQSYKLYGTDGLQQQARVYNIAVIIYTAAADIIRQQNLFSYMFTNVGDVKAWVNGMVINPSTTPATALGDSRSISAHLLDIYKGNITLSFDPASAGNNPMVEIVQLFYAESWSR